METDRLFETALGITAPWLIERIDFDPKLKQLDIHINFQRGASFPNRLCDGSELRQGNSGYLRKQGVEFLSDNI